MTASNVLQLPPRTLSGAGRFKIKTRAEILSDPEAEWLIEELYPQDSLAQVFGVPEAHKTFFAIDAACSVATGLPFLGGYEVSRTGDVVYVYAEGGRGFGKRLRAWEMYHGCEADGFFGIAEPVDMLSGEPNQLIADIKAATINPVLIVVDTLARCFGEGDENNTKEMNQFVRGCDRVRRAFPGCTVLVVHHSGWEGSRSRGARALEGALDTITRLEKGTKSKPTTLYVTKQKDFPKPEKGVPLELVDVPGSGSAVLRLADATKFNATSHSSDQLVLHELRKAGEKGLSAGEMEGLTQINSHTLRSARQRLKKRGFATDRGGRWYILSPPQLPAELEELFSD